VRQIAKLNLGSNLSDAIKDAPRAFGVYSCEWTNVQ
jgi:hypothetical protein